MKNILFSVATIGIAIVFWVESASFHVQAGGNSLSPAFFPRVLIMMIIFLAGMKLLLSWKDFSLNTEKITTYFKAYWKVPVTLVLLLVYYISINNFGFMISSIIFLAAIFLTLTKTFTPKHLIACTIITIVLPVGLQWIFANALNTILP